MRSIFQLNTNGQSFCQLIQLVRLDYIMKGPVILTTTNAELTTRQLVFVS